MPTDYAIAHCALVRALRTSANWIDIYNGSHIAPDGQAVRLAKVTSGDETSNVVMTSHQTAGAMPASNY